MTTTARLCVLVLLALAMGCGSESSAPPAPTPPADAPADAPTAADANPVSELEPEEMRIPLPDPKFELTDATPKLLAAIDERDDFERAAGLATLLSTLGPEALGDVKAILLQQRDADLGAIELVLLVRYWATHEPKEAVTWALFRSPIAYRLAVTIPAVEMLARTDPEAAVQAISPLTITGGGRTLEAAQVALIRGWFDGGHDGLERYIIGYGVGYDRQRTLNAYAREYLQRNGTDALMRWGEGLPEDVPKLRLEAFSQIATQLTLADPRAGVEWCNRHCDEDDGINVRKLVAQRWGAVDGSAAMAWASTAQNPEQREWAVLAAQRGWWRKDREGFTDWIEARKDATEPWMDPAISRYAVWITIERPQDAIEWAKRIQDTVERESAYVMIIRKWRKKDEESALAAVDELEMSDSARERARMTYDEERAQRAAQRAAPQT